MDNKKIKLTVKDLPKSCTSGSICYVGLLSFVFSLYLINKYNIDNVTGAVIAGIALIIPIIILEIIEIKSYKNPSTGLNYSLRNSFNIKRVSIKLLGLYATLSLVALFYLVLPEYHTDYYLNFWTLAKYLLIIILIGSIPYFFILDRFLVEPEESYWKVGMIVLGKWKQINFDGLKDHFLGWLVKSFFLPLMYIGLAMNVGYIKSNSFFAIFDNFDSFFNYSYVFIYTIDLAFVTIGYVMTLRIFDSHIRTVEPSFLGWIVAIQCYYPFWDSLESKYYLYNSDNFNWNNWLINNHTLFIIWGSVILFLIFIYAWSSVIFGLRFSNLTNRGILTNGPYRFMRHPAYISKNLSWWLISIPFISHEGFFEGFKNCILLLLVNYVYFLRAKTEERHLSKDPTYVKYASAMNHVGIFSALMKRARIFRYNPDTALAKTGKRILF